MYFNMFGGSALLHLLAGYPRVIAAFGIVATVGLLLSPLGAGQHNGTGAYLQVLDRRVQSYPGDAATLARGKRTTEELAHGNPQARHEAVEHVLKACGADCAKLTPSIVERDQTLLNDALLLFALDGEMHRSSSIGTASVGR